MDKGSRDKLPKHRYTTEEILGELPEAEVLLSHGQQLGQVLRLLGIRQRTHHRRTQSAGS